MCGICVIWGQDTSQLPKCLESLKARGPDSSTHTFLSTKIAVGFTRLRIQGPVECDQPYQVQPYGTVVCNGEIFNSIQLIETLGLSVPEGSSDCAVIPAMLNKGMTLAEVSRQLDGDFAIVHINTDSGLIEVSRDPYGVRPLYYAKGPTWSAISSELKGLPDEALYVITVDPGTTMTFDISNNTIETDRWHQVPWLKIPGLPPSAIKEALEAAVKKRLTTVRGIGACLSGGLDSSLVAAIASRLMKDKGPIHTYSIGMEGSPDLEHARLVAEHIGSCHHERIVTPAECLAAIPDVVRAVETCDITTIRASVGNYLLGQFIAKETPDVKVILNGDGADEALGGYLYMRRAPDEVAFETETTRLLTEIHMYDVARSERSMAAHGLESRSPFLDRQFISTARGFTTDLLRPTETRMEKTLLREAFKDTGILPEKVLWRRKEAFSDGISKAETSWYEMAKAEGLKQAGGDWETKARAYTVNSPKTPEAYWYRKLFHTWYVPHTAVVPAMWMPRFMEGASDPSARTLGLYKV